MFYVIFALFLVAFWAVLSGYFTVLLLSFGVGSAILVSWTLRRMDKVDDEPIGVRPGFGLMAYLVWLIGCVVRSNIDLARRIWDRELPVQPAWERLDVAVRTPLEKTIYANSITLTPGTLTTDVGEDHFMVHCLTQEGIDELREGEMERRIRGLGISS